MKGPIRFCLILGIVVFLPGCLTLTDRIGVFLEGNRDRTLGRYRSLPSQGRVYRVREGQGGLEILIEDFPAISLRASVPGEDGIFHLRSLEYLAGNPRGWVQFSLGLSGEGVFIPGEGVLRLGSSPEPLALSGGKIRFKDTRLGGEEALGALEGRYERIKALAEWMRKEEAPASAGQNYGDFQSYWKPLLLPELVPKRERPPARVLPEELGPLRDSGTLKRDWEECGEWIFLVYAWENIFAALESGAVTLRSE